MSPRLSHIAIMVDALEPAVELYTNGFGFQLLSVKVLPEIGVRNAFLAAGDATFVELVEFSGRGELAAGDTVVALAVDDLDDAVARLEAAGVHVVLQPATENIPYPRGWITRAEGRGTVFELCPESEVAAFVTSARAEGALRPAAAGEADS